MNLEDAIHKQTNGTIGNIHVYGFLQCGVSENLLLWTDYPLKTLILFGLKVSGSRLLTFY